jgi:hypothetical protein
VGAAILTTTTQRCNRGDCRVVGARTTSQGLRAPFSTVTSATLPTWTRNRELDVDAISGYRSTFDSSRRIVVAGQPPGAIERLESEFFWRGWIPVLVECLDDVPALVERASPAAVVVPIVVPKMADGHFCANLRRRSPEAYLPIVAYDETSGLVRAFAWNAGCDQFVPRSLGAVVLCRELTWLIDIAGEITRRLFGGS